MCIRDRLEDEETDRLYETNVACKLFDARRRRCTDYGNRSRRVPDCVRLTPDNVAALNWMPETCAYRRLANGQGLPDWHPLITRRKRDMIDAGAAVTDVIAEDDIDPEDIWDYVTAQRPRARRRAK